MPLNMVRCIRKSTYDETCDNKSEPKYPADLGSAKSSSDSPGDSGANAARLGVGLSGRASVVSDVISRSSEDGEMTETGECPPGVKICHLRPGVGAARIGDGVSLVGETSLRGLRLGCLELACLEGKIKLL